MIEDLTFLEEGTFSKRDELVCGIAKALRSRTSDPLEALTQYLEQGLARNKNPLTPQETNLVRNTRTASQIIRDGYATGCHDIGTVFVTIARAMGIPTRYTDTFSESWLRWDCSEENLRNRKIFLERNPRMLSGIERILDQRLMRRSELTEQTYQRWLIETLDPSVPPDQILNLLLNKGCMIQGHVFADVLKDGIWKPYEPLRGYTRYGTYSMKRGGFTPIGSGLDFSEIYLLRDGIYDHSPINLAISEPAIELFKPQFLELRDKMHGKYPK